MHTARDIVGHLLAEIFSRRHIERHIIAVILAPILLYLLLKMEEHSGIYSAHEYLRKELLETNMNDSIQISDELTRFLSPPINNNSPWEYLHFQLIVPALVDVTPAFPDLINIFRFLYPEVNLNQDSNFVQQVVLCEELIDSQLLNRVNGNGRISSVLFHPSSDTFTHTALTITKLNNVNTPTKLDLMSLGSNRMSSSMITLCLWLSSIHVVQSVRDMVLKDDLLDSSHAMLRNLYSKKRIKNQGSSTGYSQTDGNFLMSLIFFATSIYLYVHWSSRNRHFENLYTVLNNNNYVRNNEIFYNDFKNEKSYKFNPFEKKLIRKLEIYKNSLYKKRFKYVSMSLENKHYNSSIRDLESTNQSKIFKKTPLIIDEFNLELSNNPFKTGISKSYTDSILNKVREYNDFNKIKTYSNKIQKSLYKKNDISLEKSFILDISSKLSKNTFTSDSFTPEEIIYIKDNVVRKTTNRQINFTQSLVSHKNRVEQLEFLTVPVCVILLVRLVRIIAWHEKTAKFEIVLVKVVKWIGFPMVTLLSAVVLVSSLAHIAYGHKEQAYGTLLSSIRVHFLMLGGKWPRVSQQCDCESARYCPTAYSVECLSILFFYVMFTCCFLFIGLNIIFALVQSQYGIFDSSCARSSPLPPLWTSVKLWFRSKALIAWRGWPCPELLLHLFSSIAFLEEHSTANSTILSLFSVHEKLLEKAEFTKESLALAISALCSSQRAYETKEKEKIENIYSINNLHSSNSINEKSDKVQTQSNSKSDIISDYRDFIYADNTSIIDNISILPKKNYKYSELLKRNNFELHETLDIIRSTTHGEIIPSKTNNNNFYTNNKEINYKNLNTNNITKIKNKINFYNISNKNNTVFLNNINDNINKNTFDSRYNISSTRYTSNSNIINKIRYYQSQKHSILFEKKVILTEKKDLFDIIKLINFNLQNINSYSDTKFISRNDFCKKKLSYKRESKIKEQTYFIILRILYYHNISNISNLFSKKKYNKVLLRNTVFLNKVKAKNKKKIYFIDSPDFKSIIDDLNGLMRIREISNTCCILKKSLQPLYFYTKILYLLRNMKNKYHLVTIYNDIFHDIFLNSSIKQYEQISFSGELVQNRKLYNSNDYMLSNLVKNVKDTNNIQIYFSHAGSDQESYSPSKTSQSRDTDLNISNASSKSIDNKTNISRVILVFLLCQIKLFIIRTQIYIISTIVLIWDLLSSLLPLSYVFEMLDISVSRRNLSIKILDTLPLNGPLSFSIRVLLRRVFDSDYTIVSSDLLRPYSPGLKYKSATNIYFGSTLKRIVLPRPDKLCIIQEVLCWQLLKKAILSDCSQLCYYRVSNDLFFIVVPISCSKISKILAVGVTKKENLYKICSELQLANNLPWVCPQPLILLRLYNSSFELDTCCDDKQPKNPSFLDNLVEKNNQNNLEISEEEELSSLRSEVIPYESKPHKLHSEVRIDQIMEYVLSILPNHVMNPENSYLNKLIAKTDFYSMVFSGMSKVIYQHWDFSTIVKKAIHREKHQNVSGLGMNDNKADNIYQKNISDKQKTCAECDSTSESENITSVELSKLTSGNSDYYTSNIFTQILPRFRSPKLMWFIDPLIRRTPSHLSLANSLLQSPVSGYIEAILFYTLGRTHGTLEEYVNGTRGSELLESGIALYDCEFTSAITQADLLLTEIEHYQFHKNN